MAEIDQSFNGEGRYCSKCGEPLVPGSNFCGRCGAEAPAAGDQALDRRVVDPDGVEYIGFWVRLAAWVIDFIVLSVIQLVLSLIGLSFVALIVGVPYGVLFIGLKGQTPGKMALGIQVVDQQGNIPGIGRAVLREIIGKLVSAIVVLLGYLWISWDRHKRGWHDHIAGTYVVRKQRGRVSSF